MVECGCAIPDEAFQGLEEDNDLKSVQERLAAAGEERDRGADGSD